MGIYIYLKIIMYIDNMEMEIVEKLIESIKKNQVEYPTEKPDKFKEHPTIQRYYDAIHIHNDGELETELKKQLYCRVDYYKTKYNEMLFIERKFNEDKREIAKYTNDNQYENLYHNYEFFKDINKYQYTQKRLYGSWKHFETSLKKILVKEYERLHVKIRNGDNRFIFIPSQIKFTLTDLYTALSSKTRNDNFIIHHILFGGLLKQYMKSDIKYDYTPYTHHIEPKMMYQFINEDQEIFGHTQIYIKPVGYYTFYSNHKMPTNIDSIYFDTNGIKHTTNDLIIYELYDYHVFDYEEKMEEQLTKKFEEENINQMLCDAPIKPKTKNKKKKKKNKNKHIQNQELVDLVFYESEEDDKPKEIIKDVPVKFGNYVEFYQFDKIRKMIKNGIEKQSKFYNLVKDATHIFVSGGIHNSFHKCEKYDHFTIKLSYENQTSYHIYVDETKIIYSTRILQEFEE